MFYYNFIVFSSTLIITIFPLHESTKKLQKTTKLVLWKPNNTISNGFKEENNPGKGRT